MIPNADMIIVAELVDKYMKEYRKTSCKFFCPDSTKPKRRCSMLMGGIDENKFCDYMFTTIKSRLEIKKILEKNNQKMSFHIFVKNKKPHYSYCFKDIRRIENV